MFLAQFTVSVIRLRAINFRLIKTRLIPCIPFLINRLSRDLVVLPILVKAINFRVRRILLTCWIAGVIELLPTSCRISLTAAVFEEIT